MKEGRSANYDLPTDFRRLAGSVGRKELDDQIEYLTKDYSQEDAGSLFAKGPHFSCPLVLFPGALSARRRVLLRIIGRDLVLHRIFPSAHVNMCRNAHSVLR